MVKERKSLIFKAEEESYIINSLLLNTMVDKSVTQLPFNFLKVSNGNTRKRRY